MIGLIRVLCPPGEPRGLRNLACLPQPPATGFHAFLIQVVGDVELNSTLEWAKQIHRARPDVAIGLVVAPTAAALTALGKADFSIEPVITPAALNGGAVAMRDLDRLRRRAVAGRILERWRERFGDSVSKNLALFQALIAAGSCGRGVSAAASSVGISERWMRKRIKMLTGFRPVTLLLEARSFAYEEALHLGADPAAAREACGWFSVNAVRKARQRLRRTFSANGLASLFADRPMPLSPKPGPDNSEIGCGREVFEGAGYSSCLGTAVSLASLGQSRQSSQAARSPSATAACGRPTQ